MPATLATRKPIDQLTPDDLRAFPVWVFTDDAEEVEGQDETWVRPLNTTSVPRDSVFLSVAARFRAACGSEMHGIVGVSTRGEPELGHAALVLEAQYIFVPSPDFRGATAAYQRVAASLGLPFADVFPLSFSLVAPLDGETTLLTGEFGP